MDPADLKLLKPHKLRNHIAKSVGATIDRCIYLTGSEKRADSESKGFEIRLRKAGFEVCSARQAWWLERFRVGPQHRTALHHTAPRTAPRTTPHHPPYHTTPRDRWSCAG